MSRINWKQKKTLTSCPFSPLAPLVPGSPGGPGSPCCRKLCVRHQHHHSLFYSLVLKLYSLPLLEFPWFLVHLFDHSHLCHHEVHGFPSRPFHPMQQPIEASSGHVTHRKLINVKRVLMLPMVLLHQDSWNQVYQCLPTKPKTKKVRTQKCSLRKLFGNLKSCKCSSIPLVQVVQLLLAAQRHQDRPQCPGVQGKGTFNVYFF